MRKLLLSLPLAALFAAPTALADDAKITCNGPVTHKTIQSGLYVPRGATCQVIDATVLGEIQVNGGKLILKNSRVKGDVDVDSGTIVANDNTIEGDLEITDNRNSPEVIKKNHIYGDVSFENNARGHIEFALNTVGGDLECEDNSWRYDFYNNDVRGSQEGQCRDWR